MKNIGILLKILSQQQGLSMLGQFKNRPKWQILVSTILSASAPDSATIPVSKNLFKKYSSLTKLANANPDVVKKIIKPCVYFNNKTKYIISTAKILIKDYKGKVPDNLIDLMKLPGVGHKVANCVLVYGFNIPALPIDVHCHRISNRLGLVKTKNAHQTMVQLEKNLPKRYWLVYNELLVLHGQSTCKARKPLCHHCSISKFCNYYSAKNLQR